MKAISVSIKPAITLLEILVITTGFFIFYNKFLVSRSLDDVRFALNSIEKNEYTGLNQLLSFNLAAEAAKEKSDSESLAILEYANDVIPKAQAGRPGDDVADAMKRLVAKKEEERGPVLKFFDKVNTAVTGTLGFGAKLEDRLARNERDVKTLTAQRSELTSKLSGAASPEEKQKLLYRIGAIDMRSSDYAAAAKIFNEAATLNPTGAAGMKSLFNLAWCEKELGDTAASAKYFEDFAGQHAEEDLAKDAQFQMAMLRRKANDYKGAADIMMKMADSYEDSSMAPMALFLTAGTYLYDMQDKDAAAKVLEKLRDRYPASEFASSSTAIYKVLFTEERMRQAFNARMFSLWKLFPMSGAITEATDKAATKFVIKMIEGTIQQIELQKLDIGSMVKIEQSDKFLTDWANKYVAAKSKNQAVGINGVKIEFKEGNRIEASGLVKVGMVNMPGRLVGRMELRRTRSREGLREESQPSSESWLEYNVEECSIGLIRIPPEIMNASLARAHKIFNQKLPFSLNRFNIDAKTKTGMWAGPQRVPTSKLKTENPQNYENMYKSQ